MSRYRTADHLSGDNIPVEPHHCQKVMAKVEESRRGLERVLFGIGMSTLVLTSQALAQEFETILSFVRESLKSQVLAPRLSESVHESSSRYQKMLPRY